MDADHSPLPRERTDKPVRLNPQLVRALKNKELGLRRGTVHLEKYSLRWKQAFADVQTVLYANKPHGVQTIEHIGSTSVPGLSAKPIMDIAIGITPEAVIDELHHWLTQEGFIYRGEADAIRPDMMYGFEIEANIRIINAHVLAYGDAAWANYLNFRNHLRDNPADREAYQQLKERLVRHNANDRSAYLNGKTDFIIRRREA
ncbi:hypothetical protein AFL94_09220 [Arthrobacter sp. LS16]|nr:hypothetical protein AFL94_09220 [Arthrobacter sp. LS16]